MPRRSVLRTLACAETPERRSVNHTNQDWIGPQNIQMSSTTRVIRIRIGIAIHFESIRGSQIMLDDCTALKPGIARVLLKLVYVAAIPPSPNPSPVKRAGLPEPVFPFPSLRGEGAGVRGRTINLVK